MKNSLVFMFAILCLLLLYGVAAAKEEAPSPSVVSNDEFFRPMSDEEKRFEKLSIKPYRPKWAPLPLFREHTEFIPLLHKSLKSKNAAERARSAYMLGQIGSQSSRTLLAGLLADKDRNVRIHAGIALACLGDAKGLKVCDAAVSTEARWIKYYGILGLWNINNAESKKALQKYKDNRDVLIGPTVRGALESKYYAIPKMPARPSKRSFSKVEQVWEEGANILGVEADWWWHKGNYEQAIRCHEAAILLDPTYAEGYSIVAWLHWSRDRDDEAVEALERGLKAAPNDYRSYYNMGSYYYRVRDYKKAEGYLKKSVDLGGDIIIRRMYAQVLGKLEKNEESYKQWQEIVRLNPNDETAVIQLEKAKTKLRK